MEFNTAGMISSAAFGMCAGAICRTLTKGRLKRNAFLTMLLSLAASVVGAWNGALAYPAVMLAIAAGLAFIGTGAWDAVISAFVSAASAFDIMFFVNGMIAQSLEAYSYTLRSDFWYRCVHSHYMIAGAVALVAAMLLLIRMCRRESRLSGAIPLCVISLSLAAAAVMILHMCGGQLIDFNAGKFKYPLQYSLLTGSVSLVCAVLTCIIMKILAAKLTLPEKLSGTAEFYMILGAVILMVIFYCCENTILNNYTSFDEPVYRYIVITLIVLMLITILAALVAVCSYILRTRAEQSKMEHEIEITAMYRNEIRDMQQSIFDFKHDYVKIYSSMSSFIMNRDYERLAEFFDSNITPLQNELFDIDDDSKKLKLIDDAAVQGLIYSYVIKTKKVGVTLLVDIRDRVPEVSVPVIDLNRIIGIFLDNAIEHAAKSDRCVSFAAITAEDTVLFVVSNASNGGDIERMFMRGESSKGADRGRGLSIARKLCSSHDELSMHTYFKNGSFVCELYVDR